MWYEFNQNNSGGRFIVDDKVCHRVFVEADSAMDANDIAVNLGIYFDGCEDGRDCDCCGDRWCAQDEGNGMEFPIDYGKEGVFEDIESYAQYLTAHFGWTTPDARLYYADGRVAEINK